MRPFFATMLFFGIVFAQESAVRTFQLRNGDKVSGAVVAENDTAVVMKTSFGEITIHKSNIKPQSITLYLKDGNVVSGDVITNTEAGFTLQTSFGVVTIDKQNIDRTSESGAVIPGGNQKEEFYYGNERLIDVFFDPTGYTMEKGSIYFSGLSWGVALSEHIDISSSYWRYFIDDLNFRPKFRIYKGGSIESERSFAVGFHFHTSGYTGKQKLITVQDPVYSFSGISGYQSRNEWKDIGDANLRQIWTEVFAAYTISTLKDDKQGRVSYHFGGSMIFHPDADMPRAWIAVDNDITHKFKILAQVFYDPYQASYQERANSRSNKNPLNMDFGFVYAYDENLRFGIHYQPYILLFYWKF